MKNNNFLVLNEAENIKKYVFRWKKFYILRSRYEIVYDQHEQWHQKFDMKFLILYKDQIKIVKLYMKSENLRE